MTSLDTLKENQLKSASSGELVKFSSLWQDKPCVIIFFRRWGCLFCRLWASELSQIAAQLKENNVRLIGVGVEDLGLEEFKQGNFFDGELFVDEGKRAYQSLGYKRFNWLTMVASLVSSEARAAISKGQTAKLGGDLRGDALQVGGALVVAAGGKEVLLDFKQERPAEHLPNSRILEALGLIPRQDDTQKNTETFAGECNKPE